MKETKHPLVFETSDNIEVPSVVEALIKRIKGLEEGSMKHEKRLNDIEVWQETHGKENAYDRQRIYKLENAKQSNGETVQGHVNHMIALITKEGRAWKVSDLAKRLEVSPSRVWQIVTANTDVFEIRVHPRNKKTKLIGLKKTGKENLKSTIVSND